MNSNGKEKWGGAALWNSEVTISNGLALIGIATAWNGLVARWKRTEWMQAEPQRMREAARSGGNDWSGYGTEQNRRTEQHNNNTNRGTKTMENKELRVRLTFIEPILGTSPANEDVYRDFIGSKAPDAATVDDEVAAIGADAVIEKGKTVFPRMDDGTPFLYDYQIKGFFKDTCCGLRKVKGSQSEKIKAYKKEIDKLIFPEPRCIPIIFDGEVGDCQRPLRAQTAQGERVSLAISEEIPAGATIEFTVVMLADHEKAVREWLDYGKYSGIGQWRNSGRGRFYWEELDSTGNVIGGNKR